MSRVGNNPIAIPAGVDVKIEDRTVTVRGPKGELSRQVPQSLDLQMSDGTIEVSRNSEEPQARALHGLTRTLIANMIEGVTNGFTRTLVLEGVGYRAVQQGDKVVLTLGYSHPVEIVAPPEIQLEVPQPNTVVIRGINNELVGNVAASIRSKRPIASYRYADGPRGIRYSDEKLDLKPVKAGR